MRVLFVCTGNVCRSPMAEGFLRWEASRRGLDLEVRSTGTHAWSGRAATIDGRRVMKTLGVPIDDHRTLELAPDLVEWADLIVGMSREHTRDVIRAYPHAKQKTYTMKGLLGVLGTLPSHEDQQGWLDALWQAREDIEQASGDIEDPIGEREAAYRRVATEIRDLVGLFAEGLERNAQRLTT